jgi:FAD:protein FMN transferase
MRHALNGPTMGTRWSALFFATSGFRPEPVRAALQAAVDEVDAQMSTWKPDSDLMRLNAAPVGDWVAVPARLRRSCGSGSRSGAPRAGPSTSAWATR